MFRKLTTYLTVAATLATGAMFFIGFADPISPDGNTERIMYQENIGYLTMLIMIIAGCVLSIFTHKHPFIQARVCMLTGLLLAGFQIWLGVDFIRQHDQFIFSVSMLFPMAASALEIIAARKALIDGMALQALKYLKGNKK